MLLVLDLVLTGKVQKGRMLPGTTTGSSAAGKHCKNAAIREEPTSH
jgi:hypothetical protein